MIICIGALSISIWTWCAGVVKHPREWEDSGYREIHKPLSRYGIIDLLELTLIRQYLNRARPASPTAVGNGTVP